MVDTAGTAAERVDTSRGETARSPSIRSRRIFLQGRRAAALRRGGGDGGMEQKTRERVEREP